MPSEKFVTLNPENTPAVTPNVGQTFDDLAKLSPFEYDRRRKAEAKRLNITVKTLDAEITARRRNNTSLGEANDLGLIEHAPWPEEVDGAGLLDRIAAAIRRYVVMPAHAAEAAALWVVHAHCFDLFQHSPRLAIASPEKGCGKSTLLDVLAQMAPRTLKTENLTAAVMFRVIEAYRPTLLVDEVDSFLGDKDELRGILNAGHRRGGKAVRCEGDDNAIKAFDTFAPVATSGIGQLPGTLADRSIPITLQRRKATERIAIFRDDRAGDLHELASQCARWAADNTANLREYDPEIPAELFNRLADNWRPLLAIADIAGDDWPERARAAAIALSDHGDDAESTSIKLLSDIRITFEVAGMDRLSSKVIADSLHEMEDRPWPEWRNGKPISTNQIARLLKPFGIFPGTIRIGTDTAKGYRLEQFRETFERWLPPSRIVTPSQPKASNGYSDFESVTQDGVVTFPNRAKPVTGKDCDAVTVQTGDSARTYELCLHCRKPIGADPKAVPATAAGVDGHIHAACYPAFIGQEPPALPDRRNT